MLEHKHKTVKSNDVKQEERGKRERSKGARDYGRDHAGFLDANSETGIVMPRCRTNGKEKQVRNCWYAPYMSQRCYHTSIHMLSTIHKQGSQR